MRVRDTCFMKYRRAKKNYAGHKILRNEVKMKTKHAKKTLPGFIRKK